MGEHQKTPPGGAAYKMVLITLKGVQVVKTKNREEGSQVEGHGGYEGQVMLTSWGQRTFLSETEDWG